MSKSAKVVLVVSRSPNKVSELITFSRFAPLLRSSRGSGWAGAIRLQAPGSLQRRTTLAVRGENWLHSELAS